MDFDGGDSINCVRSLVFASVGAFKSRGSQTQNRTGLPQLRSAFAISCEQMGRSQPLILGPSHGGMVRIGHYHARTGTLKKAADLAQRTDRFLGAARAGKPTQLWRRSSTFAIRWYAWRGRSIGILTVLQLVKQSLLPPPHACVCSEAFSASASPILFCPGADSEEKHEPAGNIDTIVVDSLKALDPDRLIREADMCGTVADVGFDRHSSGHSSGRLPCPLRANCDIFWDVH